jgi:hypothetical protein
MCWISKTAACYHAEGLRRLNFFASYVKFVGMLSDAFKCFHVEGRSAELAGCPAFN